MLVSISIVKDLYSKFKIVSESFSIDLNDFKLIFSSNDNEFQLWDTDKNGLIDSFELFTGLIIFSDASPEDKYNELFWLYDFNSNGASQFDDIVFLLENIISSAIKMFNYQIEYNTDEIQKYLFQRFKIDKTNRDFYLHITDLKEFIASDTNVKEICSILNLPILIIFNDAYIKNLESINSYTKTKYFLLSNNMNINYEKGYNDYVDYIKDLDNFDFFINNNKLLNQYMLTYNIKKEYVFFINWVWKSLQDTTVLKKNLVRKKIDLLDYNADIDWIYGINIEGISRPLQYLYSGNTKYSDGNKYSMNSDIRDSILVYSIGKIIIIYNYNSHSQSYYLNHVNPVSCVCVGNINNNIIASSELASNPSIHVWSYDYDIFNNGIYKKYKHKTLQIIKGKHNKCIHLMSFTSDCEILLTIGLGNQSAVIAYDWKNNSVLYSTYINGIAQSISFINALDISDEEETQDTNLNKEEVSIEHSISNTNSIRSKKKRYLKSSFFKYSDQMLFKKYTNFFCICTQNLLYLIVVYEGNFDMLYINKDILTNSQFKCCLLLKTLYNEDNNVENYGLFFNYNENYEEIMILTGHLNGDINVWGIIDNKIEFLSKNLIINNIVLLYYH